MPESREQVLPPRSFLAIWGGQAISLLGSSLVQFALIWHLTETTGSGSVLAAASLVGLLPQILVSPLAGALVDRWNRRWIMVSADAGIALATALLAVLFATGRSEIWHIMVLLGVRSLGSAFHWPAMQASTTLMVPRDQLTRVAGMNQTLYGLVGILTPPLSALLLVLIPLQSILAIDVITALLAIGPLLVLGVPQIAERGLQAQGARRPNLWADMRDGLLYVRSRPGIMWLIGQGMLIRLFMGAGVALLPLLVQRRFGGGAMHLATLRALGGVGTLVGGLVLSVWGVRKRRMLTSMIGLALDGLAIFVIGVAPAQAFCLALAAIMISGFVEPIIFGIQGAMAQTLIPPEMQGRVFGLAGGLGTAMSPLGLAVAGPVADAYGAQVWFVVGGLVTAVMGLSGMVNPHLTRLEQEAAGNVERAKAMPVTTADTL